MGIIDNYWKQFVAIVASIFGFYLIATQPFITGAYDTLAVGPQAELMTSYYTWAHYGSVTRCNIEVYAQDNATIYDVAMYATSANGTILVGTLGFSPSYSTRNSTNWVHWYSDAFTVPVTDNVTCFVRIQQKKYNPDVITSNYTNFTFYPIGYAISGCEGKADCSVSTSIVTILANRTIRHRTLNFTSGSMNIYPGNNVTFEISESFINGGRMTLDGITSMTIHAYSFTNKYYMAGTGTTGNNSIYGTPSFSGQNGTIIYLDVGIFNNTNIITLTGGRGGNGYAYANYPGSGDVANASSGGNGGQIIMLNTKGMMYNTGTITLIGGNGGTGIASWVASGASCQNLSGTTVFTAYSGKGGSSGLINVSTIRFTNTGTYTLAGGIGGAGYGSERWYNGWCCTACANGGNGGDTIAQNITIAGNITVTNNMVLNGGLYGSGIYFYGSGSCGDCQGAHGAVGNTTNGTWLIYYNLTGANNSWVKIQPGYTATRIPAITQPSSFVATPNATTNLTALIDNLSVSIGNYSTNYTYQIYYTNGQVTWSPISAGITSAIPSESLQNYTLTSHGFMDTVVNTSRVVMRVYDNVTKVYGTDLVYSDNFTITPISTILVGSATPNGTVSTRNIYFMCNYTNATGNTTVWNPTAIIYIDNVSYNMTWNPNSYVWEYNSTSVGATQSWLGGVHTWYCSMSRTDYATKIRAIENISLGGYSIAYPYGITSVRFLCPFPTISNMQPAGQKAKVGILRIINYNTTMLNNYSIMLNGPAPTGVSIYARCDKFSLADSNWTLLNEITAYQCWNNINSTNTTAYLWMKMDCLNAVPQNTTTFDYVVAQTN